MPTLFPPAPVVNPNALPPMPGADLNAIQPQNGDQPSPQQVIAQQTQQVLPAAVQDARPFLSQEAPADKLAINSKQYTAGTVDTNAEKAGLANQEGQQKSDMLNNVANVQDSKAAQAQLDAANFNSNLEAAKAAANTEHTEHWNAYQDYKKLAGNLKDPSSQFWEDKGQGSRVLAALGLAASGFNGNDHFMNFLNKEIDNNYNAHKQNIDDLYRSAVEAGKIEDSTDNKNRWDADTKLKSYDLARMAFADQIDSATNRGNSQIAKTLGKQVVAGLTQDSLTARRNQAIQDAQAATAGQAAARARQKEMLEHYKEYVISHGKDMGDDEARRAAFKDVQGEGYSKSELAMMAQGQGIGVNSQGEFAVKPTNATPTSTEPVFDPATSTFKAPSVDANGKRIAPEIVNAAQEKLNNSTANFNGQPVVFRTKEDAETQKILPQAESLINTLNTAWKSGDIGTYKTAKKQLVELAPKLLGYKRAPSLTQAGSESAAALQDKEDIGTIGGQIPDMEEAYVIPGQTYQALKNKPGIKNYRADIQNAQLDEFNNIFKSIKEGVANNIVNAPTKVIPTAGASVEDILKQFGGTPDKSK